MKYLAIFLALGIYGTAFSAEHLASIDHDADLSTLPVNTVIQFTNKLKFSYQVERNAFSSSKTFQTSQGYGLFCRLYIPQERPILEEEIIIQSDSNAKVIGVSILKNGVDHIGNTYKIDLMAETPDRAIPLTIRCNRSNEKVDNNKDAYPSNLSIQDFLDVSKDTLQIIEVSESKVQTPVVTQQADSPKSQDLSVLVQEPKVEVKPTPVAPVVVKKLKVECDFKDESSNQKIYLDTQVDPSGYTTASGYKNDVSVKLTYNRQRPVDGREIIVSFDGYNLNKSLKPGLGSISFETGMITKMLGIKRKLKVECFPERERLVEE